jgi:SNF2 family DNA or RNA helicase
MTLRDYQYVGANFLADDTKRKNHLLGDEPGLGKTLQAIRACDEVLANRVLVLCQAIAKIHWQREFVRWQLMPRNVTVITSQADQIPDTGVVIVNYDMIQRQDHLLRKKLLRQKWDVLILDEAHAMKNPDAKKTRYIYGVHLDGRSGLVASAERVWLLTGTPAPNHMGELWTHLHALAPDLILDPVLKVAMPEHIYRERYVQQQPTPYGMRVTGSKNLSELKTRLDKFMLRRRKKDVLQDLPPLDFTMLPLALDAAKIPTALLDELRELEEASKNDALLQAAIIADQIELMFRPGMMGAISTERRVLGEIKAFLAAELINAELEADPKLKLIVFSHHLSVLDQLWGLIPHITVRVDGRTSPHDRQRAIDNFQNDSGTRVFLGQTVAAGTSITLTASSNVIIVEPSFVPKDNLQAASRAHRIGQRDSVFVRYLTIPGTLDEHIVHTLYRKTRDIAALLADDLSNLGLPTP